MKITEKKLLEIFHNGVNCLAERRQINYETFMEIEKLLKHNRIQVNIKKI